MTVADLIGQIIFGWGSVFALAAMFVYSDDLSNGNIEKEVTKEPDR